MWSNLVIIMASNFVRISFQSCNARLQIILLIRNLPHLDTTVNKTFFIHFYSQSHSLLPFLPFEIELCGQLASLEPIDKKWRANKSVFGITMYFILQQKPQKISFIALLLCIKIILSLLGFLSFLRYIWMHINASAIW